MKLRGVRAALGMLADKQGVDDGEQHKEERGGDCWREKTGKNIGNRSEFLDGKKQRQLREPAWMYVCGYSALG